MSNKEISRLDVLNRLQRKELSQLQGAELLGIGVRQVKRLVRAFKRDGPAALASKRRGKPSNRRLSSALRAKIVALIGQHYYDFGPTLAHEKLSDVHALNISLESVRRVMISAGYWKAKRARKPVLHQMRERRPRYGELIQIDGSPHDWFEGRHPACTLLVMIDDATGKLMHLSFSPTETTAAYFAAFQDYLSRHGKPLALYSDRAGIFRVNRSEATAGDGLTQFGRAMHELDIEIICAHSPQAKGRVERANQTLQDRLTKEMRLAKINSPAQAAAFLPRFIENINKKFAVQPASQADAHRPLMAGEDLTRILVPVEIRTLTKDLTFQYNKVLYQIKTNRPDYTLRKAQVVVREVEPGQIVVEYRNKPLQFEVFRKQERQSEIADSKELNSKVEAIPTKPAANHRWRHMPVGKAATTTRAAL